MAGSTRIFDHTTFAELQWIRDPFSPTFYRLPPGFQTRSHLLTKELIEVLEDVDALQCIRDVPRFTKGDIMQMAHINNHTASIQSRLVGLENSSPVLECCYLATYLCSVMLCCKVWCALVIPVGKPRTFHTLSLVSLIFVKKSFGLARSDEMSEFSATLICENADSRIYSTMFLHNCFANYNRRTTAPYGMITLTCYSGSCTLEGHLLQQEVYAPITSYCCARTTLQDLKTCTNHGQSYSKS